MCYQLRNMPTSTPQATAYHFFFGETPGGGMDILCFAVLPAGQRNEMWAGSPRYRGSAAMERRSSSKTREKRSARYFRMHVTKDTNLEPVGVNARGEFPRGRDGGSFDKLFHLLIQLRWRYLHGCRKWRGLGTGDPSPP